MKKTIIGLLIFLIGVGLVIFGLVFNYSNISNDKKEEQILEKDPNTVENKNKGLKKEKCLDNLCINNLKITNQAGIYSVTGTLKNNGTDIVYDKAINLVFTRENGSEIKKTYYINSINKNEEVPLEIQFTTEEKSLMEVTNYKIEYASIKEYNAIKNSIVD